MKAVRKIALTILALCVLVPAMPAPALAELLVIPIRVSFGPRERAQAVTLVNTSAKTNTYRMEWKYFRLTEAGGMVEVPEAQWPQKFKVSEMVRIAPRQVTIPPEGKQVIRLSLRRPADLADGEYRAYLSLTRLADMSAVAQNPQGRGTGISLGVNLNLNVPVVVRQGEGDAAARIGDVSFQPPSRLTSGKPAVRVDLLGQDSIFSPYGRLNIFWKDPAGEEKLIGFVENAYIYPEIKKRTYTVPLNVSAVEGGSLRIEYIGIKEYENRVFDRKVVPVGK